MRKDFYLFRHGETDCNLEKRWQGSGIDAELNATGLQQAHQLAEDLKPLNLEIIHSSPLKRAHKTAEICGNVLNIPVVFNSELREGCFGKAEGMIKEEIEAAYPDIVKIWYESGSTLDIRFPDGESKQEIQNRMCAVLDEIATEPYTRIGIASHGSSLRYLLHFHGQAFHKISNAQVFHLVWEDGIWRLED